MERKEYKEVKAKKDGIIEYLILGILTLLLFPLIVPAIVFALTDKNKCKHWRECPLYRKKDIICNKEGGMYYDIDRAGGCYYEMEKRKKEAAQQGKKLRRLR